MRILKGIGDMGPFVNEKMLAMADEDSTRLDARKKVFIDTFKILNAPQIGDSAFKRYYAESKKFKGGFRPLLRRLPAALPII